MTWSTKERAEHAIAVFADHKIVDQGDRWWLIGKAGGGSEYRAAVFVMPTGELVVQGDIDLCSFAWGPRAPAECVFWIGRQESDSYVCEKATIGMTAREMVWELDRDALNAAVEDWLEGVRAEINEDGEGTHRQREAEAAFEEALDALRHGAEPEDVLGRLIGEDVIESDAARAAEVPTSRVVYAWAAVRRLRELLQEEKKA